MHAKDSRESIFRILLDGNRKFRRRYHDFRVLAESQHPEFIVITCSDSRVPSSIIMDAPLGTVFEVRTAGGVVDKAALASVEFAVDRLGAKKILVIGHTNCGAVTAGYEHFLNKEDSTAGETALENAIHSIAGIIEAEYSPNLDANGYVAVNARAQMNTLLSSSVIRELYRSGILHLAYAIYNLETGILEIM